MKLFRHFVLSLVIVAFPTLVLHAAGQQEVSPDHFDQVATPVNAHSSAVQSKKKVASAKNHRQSNVKMAGKHSHHRARVSA